MKPCSKRQVERRGGTTTHRCVNKNADQYKLPVCESQCSICPVRVFKDSKTVKKPRNEPDPLDDSKFPICEYRSRASGGQWFCGISGLPVDIGICNRCVKEERDQTPSLVGKVVKYASAVRKWVAAGKPERTQEEIDAIYESHCSKCSMYDKVKKICNSCGCPANTNQPALTNKLRMATEECPLGRFEAKVKTNA